MNKKTIIGFVVLLAVLLAGVAVAVYFLYSDEGGKTPKKSSSDNTPVESFFQVVPADAVTVLYFKECRALTDMLLAEDNSCVPVVPSGNFQNFLASLDAADKAGRLGSVHNDQAILSYHYVGGLEPLLVIDLCRSGASTPPGADVLEGLAKDAGLFCEVFDGEQVTAPNSYPAKRKVFIVSTSDVLVKSSQRHIEKGISVTDKDFFPDAEAAMQGEKVVVFLSDENIGKLVETVSNREYRQYSEFFKRYANWTAFAVEKNTSDAFNLVGTQFNSQGPDKYANVFLKTGAGTVTAFGMMPSYCVSAFAMPVANVDVSITAYSDYYAAKSGNTKYTATLSRLKSSTDVAPKTWAEQLNIKELAIASFYVGDAPESVLLVRPGNTNALVDFFSGLDTKADSSVADYPYGGFVSALFGGLFGIKDESRFIYSDGWIVVGSQTALDEYLSGKALENTLSSYLAGAGMNVTYRNQHFLGYFSFSQSDKALERLFRDKYAKGVKAAFEDAVYAPMLVSISPNKGHDMISVTVGKFSSVKSNAPEIERDTTVDIPTGPFEVKNSGTGKMNKFYQQTNMYLCLQDENGKGLWGAPFKTPICGRATTVDYFANDKLQIIFASGSKLYLIDRLGRFVSPFPVDLGKEILLGPDVYDFNGQRKYNVLVLHTDNTIEMYNLQGKKPEQWKGIAPSETVMDLPERIVVGNKTYWAVRTSLQTLIYPFYGGEALTNLQGNNKIRPDSALTPVSGGVRVTNYSGKEVTINLK